MSYIEFDKISAFPVALHPSFHRLVNVLNPSAGHAPATVRVHPLRERFFAGPHDYMRDNVIVQARDAQISPFTFAVGFVPTILPSMPWRLVLPGPSLKFFNEPFSVCLRLSFINLMPQLRMLGHSFLVE